MSEQNKSVRSENAQLIAALDSSRWISAAIGMLMATYKLSYDDGFGVLRRITQQSHRKLREVARDVLETGSPFRGTWTRSLASVRRCGPVVEAKR